ncbi:T-cell surface glycoprotein CD8 alpha chain isoform X2 [Mustelus asterias]
MKLLGFLLVIRVSAMASFPRLRAKEQGHTTIPCSLKADEGVYWFWQGEDRNPVSLVYISGSGRTMPANSAKYTAGRSSSKVHLMVKDFRKEDSGKYYCFMVKNMVMVFGHTTEVYLEEKATTPKPTTTRITKKTTLNTPEYKETTTCRPSESVTSKDELSCHIIIWAPLAGGAFFLLLALIVVSIGYCRRPRRRRCQHQLRNRPMAEEFRKPTNGYY